MFVDSGFIILSIEEFISTETSFKANMPVYTCTYTPFEAVNAAYNPSLTYACDFVVTDIEVPQPRTPIQTVDRAQLVLRQVQVHQLPQLLETCHF